MSMFAAKKSGMASMVEGLIPPQVMEALTMAKDKLPLVIQQVTDTVQRIEAQQMRVEEKLDLILAKLETQRLDSDPSATPQSTPFQEYLAAHYMDNVLCHCSCKGSKHKDGGKCSDCECLVFQPIENLVPRVR